MTLETNHKDSTEYFSVDQQKEIARWVGLDADSDPEGAREKIVERCMQAMMGEISVTGQKNQST